MNLFEGDNIAFAKFNPYHDRLGRFTSPNGGFSTFSANPNTRAGQLAIQRREERKKNAASVYAEGKEKATGAAKQERASKVKELNATRAKLGEAEKELNYLENGFRSYNVSGEKRWASSPESSAGRYGISAHPSERQKKELLIGYTENEYRTAKAQAKAKYDALQNRIKQLNREIQQQDKVREESRKEENAGQLSLFG